MRRPTLSTKLIAAALPLVVAVVALLGITVRSDLNDVQRAESGADLGAVWNPLIVALTAIETEAAQSATPDSGDAPLTATRRATDRAVNDLRDDVESLGAFEAANGHITSGRSALSAARRNLDMLTIAPELPSATDPFEAYGLASRELVAVGQLLPSEAGDPTLGRELLAVVKLAEAKLNANSVIAGTQQWQADPSDITPLVAARSAYGEMEATLGEFEAIAPDEWAAQYRQSGFATELARYRASLDRAMRAAEAGQPGSFDTASFRGLVDNGVEFQSAISQEIVDRSSLEADSVRSATLIRIAISLGAVLLAALIALFITRSITRRIKAVSNSANQVAGEQLPALVEALRDPRGKSILPDIQPVDAKGDDELAELAGAFNSIQNTLVDVAHEQVEVLRRGVSDIFVTMARRNRSLIDRQLALLDEYEAEVDDPAVLSNYYQLDHLATRMRRNSESLLVLASAEPRRRRVGATEIDDVVRASIGEVEDYRRIDVEHLESLRVRGTVVADISHLVAELLDNATAFSPPDSPVRVGGRRVGDSYLLRIVDGGIGIPTQRLGELNELLREPPVVGLNVEPTLGISVVSLLADKHGIAVTLAAGNPGLTVDVSLPSTLLGPIEEPSARPTESPAPIVAGDDHERVDLDGVSIDDPFEPIIEFEAPEPQPAPVAATDHGHRDQQPVAASDWASMSLNLSAFQAGQQTAAKAHDEHTQERYAPATEDESETFVPAHQPLLPPPTGATMPTAPNLSPPATIRTQGEFDTPLAPPVSADGPSRGPVVPETARSAPVQPLHNSPSLPTLPTRSPSSGPTGPDRLIDARPPDDTVAPAAPSSAPSALQAALSAFDSVRNDSDGPNGSLPTRVRVDEPIEPIDEPLVAATSRPDPDALRERLRAFQTEFSSAVDSDHGAGTSEPGSGDGHRSDLEGDLR